MMKLGENLVSVSRLVINIAEVDISWPTALSAK